MCGLEEDDRSSVLTYMFNPYSRRALFSKPLWELKEQRHVVTLKARTEKVENCLKAATSHRFTFQNGVKWRSVGTGKMMNNSELLWYKNNKTLLNMLTTFINLFKNDMLCFIRF